MKQKEVLVVIPSKEIIVGDKDAPVRLVMFGDYESEACAKATEVVGQLLTEHEGEMNFVFRHFPMTRIHQKAHKAAEAAIGAAQEGKFWEMHNLLFSRRLNLGVISLKGYARDSGVKDKKFLDHLINSDWGWYVQDDLREGISLGVTDIPAIFINDERFEKEPTVKNLKAHIQALLKAKPSKIVGVKEKKRA
jgi:protein-disulfide isomerase